jgi:hypothetical protein
MAPKQQGRKRGGKTQQNSNNIQTSGDNKDICPECSNHVSDTQKGLLCEAKRCNQWFHAQCAGIKNDQYNFLSKQKNIKWYCDNCVDIDENSDTNIDKLSSQMNQVMNIMTNLVERLTRLEEKKSTKEPELIEDIVKAKVTEVMEETKEREKRKLNLVFVNVNEEAGTDEERNKRDVEKINSMVKKILPQETDIKITNPQRLGSRNAGSRPRMLKVTVSSENVKWNILKNSNKINEGSKKSPKERIYVNPDYTTQQREQNKKLRQELKDRIEKGEIDLIIRGDKIIKKRPTQDHDIKDD